MINPLTKECPVAYCIICVLMLSVAFAASQRVQGIFACSAAEYEASRYLAYCNSSNYGDYDHGAFWFDLEPDTIDNAVAADVLFLGTSRMQFALSSNAVAEWFVDRDQSFYLMGFSHTENTLFVDPLLQMLRPRAQVFIVNVDGFFEPTPSAPAADILAGGDVADRYARKRLWQSFHRRICSGLPWVCGSKMAFYRAYQDGRWRLSGSEPLDATSIGEVDSRLDAGSIDRARSFLGRLEAGDRCVILTLAPSLETPRGQAEQLAATLNLPLIAPEGAGLRTFDGSHLDPPSAEAWSEAFLKAAGQRITECLAERAGPVG